MVVLHVLLKVVSHVMVPMILYCLSLLPWTHKALHTLLQPLQLCFHRREKIWQLHGFHGII